MLMIHKQVEVNHIFQKESKGTIKWKKLLNQKSIPKLRGMFKRLWQKTTKNFVIQKKKKQKDKKESDKRNCSKEKKWRNTESSRL